MRVTVRYSGPLRGITGKNEENIELDTALNVKLFLAKLARKYGKEFSRFVFEERGEIKRYLIFLLNGKKLDESEVLATTLKDGDDLYILTVAGGG